MLVACLWSYIFNLVMIFIYSTFNCQLPSWQFEWVTIPHKFEKKRSFISDFLLNTLHHLHLNRYGITIYKYISAWAKWLMGNNLKGYSVLVRRTLEWVVKLWRLWVWAAIQAFNLFFFFFFLRINIHSLRVIKLGEFNCLLNHSMRTCKKLLAEGLCVGLHVWVKSHIE